MPYRLRGADGSTYLSALPGTLGGGRGGVPALRDVPARRVRRMEGWAGHAGGVSG
jgi:hypothetical protein